MALRVLRKTKRVYAPGSFSRQKVNPWYTLSLNKKNKKRFARRKKMFSSELRQPFYKKALLVKNSFQAYEEFKFFEGENHEYNQDASLLLFENAVTAFCGSVGAIEYKKSLWRPFLSASWWAFNHPIGVAGAVKMRRAKYLYKVKQQSVHNLKLWYGNLHVKAFVCLYEQLKFWNFHTYSFALLFDHIWLTLVVKMGLFQTVLEAKKSFKHGVVNLFALSAIDCMQACEPGKGFSANKVVWNKQFKSFQKGSARKLVSPFLAYTFIGVNHDPHWHPPA